MLDKLKLYLDLNDITDNNDYMKIGYVLLENKGKKLYVFTKKGVFLDYFQKYLNDNITGEDFVILGDISSSNNIEYKGVTHEIFFKIYNDIKKLSKEYKDSVFIFDQKAFLNFKTKFADMFAFLEEYFSHNNCIYFVI